MQRETRIRFLYVVSLVILFSTLLALDGYFTTNALEYQEQILKAEERLFLTK